MIETRGPPVNMIHVASVATEAVIEVVMENFALIEGRKRPNAESRKEEKCVTYRRGSWSVITLKMSLSDKYPKIQKCCVHKNKLNTAV